MTSEHPIELVDIAKRLVQARTERGWTQAQLAQRAGVLRPQVTYFETGARTPDLDHLLRLARALELPVQRFLSGTNRPGYTWEELAFELKALGLIDLWVTAPRVPGAFHRPEDVIATLVGAPVVEPRVLEALPAVLAWNKWHAPLLYGYALWLGDATVRRLAWLGDVTLAIDRSAGFPGGCPGRRDLETFLNLVRPPAGIGEWDGFGHPVPAAPRSPVWRRWRVGYPAALNTFRQRAVRLSELHAAEGRELPNRW
jgi:putative transcriptional regulator